MLKKRILILSGKIYRGVVKLTNLEANYLEIELTAHFLPPGDYVFLLKIGEFAEKLYFNGEKLYKKIAFGLPFDRNLQAAVIETDPFSVLMSASTEKTADNTFSRLFDEYIKEKKPQRSENTPGATEAADAVADSSKKISAEDKGAPEDEKRIKGEKLEAKKRESDAENLRTSFKKALEEELKKPPAAEKSFFDGIRESVTEFFEKYPPYAILSDIVPSSKWVKVDTGDTFYVVGLLFNTSGITHICYGIPGEYSVKPPSDVLTEWLPLNPEEWDKSGFWMIYQNAETGQV